VAPLGMASTTWIRTGTLKAASWPPQYAIRAFGSTASPWYQPGRYGLAEDWSEEWRITVGQS
jgi:hypothetical protein